MHTYTPFSSHMYSWYICDITYLGQLEFTYRYCEKTSISLNPYPCYFGSTKYVPPLNSSCSSPAYLTSALRKICFAVWWCRGLILHLKHRPNSWSDCTWWLLIFVSISAIQVEIKVLFVNYEFDKKIFRSAIDAKIKFN